MVLPMLKKLRVVLSLLFFLATTIVLLDFTSVLPPALVRTILFLQFIPSLVNFIAAGKIAAVGFIAILILTLLFGRVYCSTICPVGTLQDVISFSSRKLRKGKYHDPLEPHKGIHLAFLIVTALPVLAGSMFAVSLLDPFSNFGRISGSLLRPFVIVVNNTAASLLEHFDRFDIYPVELKSVALASIILPLAFLSLVGWMSVSHGRLYCNSICPVGSFLRLVARYSVFRIVIDAERCKSCQLCQRVCKAGCIDRKSKSVDFNRCVGCFNCLTACPSEGLKIVPAFRTSNSHKQATDEARRSFLLGTPLLLLGSKVGNDTSKVIKPQKASSIPEHRHLPVTPPGSTSLRHFTHTCTACHVCLGACPSQVLQPSFLHYGLGGLLQPVMDFNASYCNFECTTCTEVCPSGALKRMTVEEKKISQAGRVVFIKQNCVVFTENTDCGACTEHCPTKAVTMIPYKNSRMPEIKQEYCVGCGACEHACPTRPYKAIYVDGNAVHLLATKKPPESKPQIDLKQDFPF